MQLDVVYLFFFATLVTKKIKYHSMSLLFLGILSARN